MADNDLFLSFTNIMATKAEEHLVRRRLRGILEKAPSNSALRAVITPQGTRMRGTVSLRSRDLAWNVAAEADDYHQLLHELEDRLEQCMADWRRWRFTGENLIAADERLQTSFAS